MDNQRVMHMSSACPGVDPRANQGDCKMGGAKLRNSPRGGGICLIRQSPLGQVLLNVKDNRDSLNRGDVFMIFGDKILLIHVRLGEAI